jgi:hypothetical protein
VEEGEDTDVGLDDVGAGFFGGLGPVPDRVVVASVRIGAA